MSFLNFSHVQLSDAFIKHVLVGDEDMNLGGHLAGLSRPGKTEFPSHWDTDAIVSGMRAVLDKPEVVRFSGKRIFLQKTVSGVFIEMKLVVTKAGIKPTSCFPLYGEHVVRNVFGQQISLDDVHNGDE